MTHPAKKPPPKKPCPACDLDAKTVALGFSGLATSHTLLQAVLEEFAQGREIREVYECRQVAA